MTAVKFYEHHKKVIALCVRVGDTRKSDCQKAERNVYKQNIKKCIKDSTKHSGRFPSACVKLIMGHVGLLCLVTAINKLLVRMRLF